MKNDFEKTSGQNCRNDSGMISGSVVRSADHNEQVGGVSCVSSLSAGFSLLELLIAMFMMVMVSAMLYSVLNVGISFASKGEARMITGERQRAFLELLHRQVHGTWYSKNERKIKIAVEEDTMRLVTTSPLLNRNLPLTMAFYHYDRRDGTVYYAEKIDFYNPDYFDDYTPVIDEMIVLLEDVTDFALEYDENEGVLKVSYEGLQYEFVPRCWVDDGES